AQPSLVAQLPLGQHADSGISEIPGRGRAHPAGKSGALPGEARRGLVTALRSLLFNVYFLGISTVLAIAYLPFLLLPPRYFWPAARVWVRLVLGGLRVICGLRSRIEGQENFPQGAGLIAAKHQSAW